MKNLNFTNSCTININWNIYTIFIQLKTTFFDKSVKTINSNNTTKFEVNLRRGSPKSIQTVRLSIPITAKFEVNWPRGSQFIARHTKNRLQFDE
jgi:hypothetical protein